MLGRRGITQRLTAVERAITAAAATVLSGETSTGETAVRANLLLNDSFELFNRGTTTPTQWTTAGFISTASSGGDGIYALFLTGTNSASQQASNGASLPAGSVVASIAARTTDADQQVVITVSPGSGEDVGPIMRIDSAGGIIETAELPSDGEWYRFYRSVIFTGGSPVTMVVKREGSAGTVEFDAAKFEQEVGSIDFIEPTAYVGNTAGTAEHIRNLSADNIVAGTLTVGGSDSANPQISVLDSSDTEVVTIGSPSSGFYGIEVKAAGGMRVSGTGDIEVTGSGAIRAGTDGHQRVELTVAGLSGYNSSGVPQVQLSATDGTLEVLGEGGVEVTGGGSILSGTPGASRVELKTGGFYVYDSEGTETGSISAVDGKMRIDADSLLIDGLLTLDSLIITGDLTLGADFRIGSNILFVDVSQSNVGINKAPDPQFDLDVSGSLRAGGYIVGKHALQLSDALMICHFDGATDDPADLTGDPTGHRGQIASIAGTAQFVPGKFGKALSLTTSSSVAVYDGTQVNTDTGSLSVWANLPTAVSGPPLSQVVVSYGGDYTNMLTIEQRSNQYRALVGTEVVGSVAAPAGEWTHLVLTWTGTTAVFYADGAAVGSLTFTTGPIVEDTELYVGNNSGLSAWFEGYIDDLVLLGRVLTADEVTAVYESDAPVFAETSTWAWRTPNTLAWADSEGLWAIDDAGNAALGVSGVDSKAWGNLGGTLLDKGDVLLGNSGNYVLWDASAGALKVNGQMVVGSSSNKLWLNDANDGGLAIGGTTKASAPFRVTSAGALTATNATLSGVFSLVSGGNGLWAGSGGSEFLAIGGANRSTAPFRVEPDGRMIADVAAVEKLEIWGGVEQQFGFAMGTTYGQFFTGSSFASANFSLDSAGYVMMAQAPTLKKGATLYGNAASPAALTSALTFNVGETSTAVGRIYNRPDTLYIVGLSTSSGATRGAIGLTAEGVTGKESAVMTLYGETSSASARISISNGDVYISDTLYTTQTYANTPGYGTSDYSRALSFVPVNRSPFIETNVSAGSYPVTVTTTLSSMGLPSNTKAVAIMGAATWGGTVDDTTYLAFRNPSNTNSMIVRAQTSGRINDFNGIVEVSSSGLLYVYSAACWLQIRIVGYFV